MRQSRRESMRTMSLTSGEWTSRDPFYPVIEPSSVVGEKRLLNKVSQSATVAKPVSERCQRCSGLLALFSLAKTEAEGWLD